MDKTIIEAIKDPLTHLVRNAADHGIEEPQTRLAQGKPAEGRIFLRAFHEGGQVNIEISDDGAGIDPQKVRRRALQRGLITGEQAARMGEREAINLIFLPGFSTAEKVTNISGRGVGMDVVKTNIEKISGTVDIQSKLGHGTSIKIKIPLTLAIIPALIITSGGDRYAIPLDVLGLAQRANVVSELHDRALAETAAQAHESVADRQTLLLFRVGEQGRLAIPLSLVARLEEFPVSAIERAGQQEVVQYRGRIMPLIRLAEVLNYQPGAASPTAAELLQLVVYTNEQRSVGLVVDEILDIVEEAITLQRHARRDGVLGSAVIQQRVTDLLDVQGIIQTSDPIFFEQALAA